MKKSLVHFHIYRYKALPIWLQRFTPASIYVKVMDAGILELKKGKDEVNCNLAVEILSALIAQTFRQHKKAEWYAEKALILRSYLNHPEDVSYIKSSSSFHHFFKGFRASQGT